MNSFTEKGIVKKTILILVIILLFNFIYSSIPISFVYAANEEAAAEEEDVPGGILLSPLTQLIAGIGEGIMWIIQSAVVHENTSFILIKQKGVIKAFLEWLGNGTEKIGNFVVRLIKVDDGFEISDDGTKTDKEMVKANELKEENLPNMFYFPIYQVTPEEIFADKLAAFHVNFINPTHYSNETYTNLAGQEKNMNAAVNLAPVIAKWYVAVRNIVIVALMVVLLYIGIRILISTAAEEKAKYKEGIKNWLVALIMVIFMHYIMAFALTMTEYVTNVIDGQLDGAYVTLPKNISEKIEDIAGDEYVVDELNKSDSGDGYTYQVNLMELARIRQQLIGQDEEGNQLTAFSKIGYTVIYFMFVFYTLTFVFVYLRRLVYMAFLTLVAPIVALTYPIDKYKDGQAQAFSSWLKEYMYNLLLQPLHLLLYMLLVGTAMDLATTNMLYAIVALGFLMEAEQLMRKFFGFEKASTTGKVMGGLLGGALVMNAINNVGKFAKKKDKSGGKDGGKSKVRTADGASKLGRGADPGHDTDDLLAKGLGGDKSLPGDGGDKGLPGDAGINDKDVSGEDDQELLRLQKAKDDAKEKYERLLGASPSDKIALYNQGKAFSEYMKASRDLDFYKANKEAQERLNEKKDLSSSLNGDVRMQTKNPRSHRRIRGIANVAKKYAPKIGRTAVRFTTAASLGTMGVAAGLVSGDNSNILKYGALGVGAGAALGGAVFDAPGRIIESSKEFGSGVKEAYREAAYTESEQKQIKREESDKAWEKDKEVNRKYEDEFDKQYKEMMEKAKKYRQYGIDDDKIIIKAMKLNLKDQNVDSDERIALAKIAHTVQTEDDLKAYGDRLKDQNISEDRIKEINKQVRKIKGW